MWRGLACLFVVVFHTTTVATMNGGRGLDLASARTAGEVILALTRYLWIGVPMFFVISGYCISGTVDSAQRKGRPVGDYFLRRFRRIFPPYWAGVAVQVGVVLIVDVIVRPGLLSHSAMPVLQPWDFSPTQWLGNLTLTESWRPHLLGADRGYILGQSWTLAYEEQFYALTGLALALVPRRYFMAAVALTFGTLLAKHGSRHLGYDASGFFFDGRWLMFAAGILVYHVRNYGHRKEELYAMLLLLLSVTYAYRERDLELGAAIVMALILLGLSRWDDRIVSLRALRPVGFLGVICYSLYLTHVPVVRALSQIAWEQGLRGTWATLAVVVPGSAAIAILVGWGFYLAVERHFLNTAPAARGTAVLDAAADVRCARRGGGPAWRMFDGIRRPRIARADSCQASAPESTLASARMERCDGSAAPAAPVP